MSHNDITGDRIATRPATEKFREGWDGIFGKPQPAVGCPQCGSTGLHACPGHPIMPWTPEKIAEFNRVLDKYEDGGSGK